MSHQVLDEDQTKQAWSLFFHVRATDPEFTFRDAVRAIIEQLSDDSPWPSEWVIDGAKRRGNLHYTGTKIFFEPG